MASFVHYSAITKPDLLDIVDDLWRQETLPNDGIPHKEGPPEVTPEHGDLHGERKPSTAKKDWPELALQRMQ
eukprot:CAMPEP_0206143234 /NCGR_PEP_ID=MMETSP1473-20131121/19784_1 /ASSEMBLY_ACC=CAM_ASM_001109 /TAXON_ID=1461547 /ORGANISM="Stichococcus sp, Strain RCC1054" /LENGTH=71 /DNA_ID=CAMNT_0053538553 /DNA_START=154 /DNA_END=369 /DNA_ORIENTATION=+